MSALRNRWVLVCLSALCLACPKAPETTDTSATKPPTSTAPPAASAPTPTPPQICKQSTTDCDNKDQCAPAPITTAAATIPTAPRCIPRGEGGNPAQQYIDMYSWNMFLALNWPADTASCSANTSKSILGVQSNDGTYVVWQTFMPGEKVFVNPGYEKPAAWCSGNGLSAGANRVFDQEAKAVPEAAKLGGPFAMIAEPGQDVLQAAGGVVTDQSKRWLRYERLMNKTEYDYITDGRWSMPLLAALKTPIAIPENSIEIKSAWKILTPDELSSKKYFTTQGTVCNTPDGQKISPCDDKPVTFGLVGLHIVQQANTGGVMFWATFEQNDNDKVFAGSGEPNKNNATKPFVELDKNCMGINTPTNIQRVTPIPSDPAINTYYQQLLGTSVFSNYRLVSTQWTAGVDLRGTPPNVANITLETYVQSLKTPIKNGDATGCMACHLNATTRVKGQSSNHSFFFLEAKYATMPPKK